MHEAFETRTPGPSDEAPTLPPRFGNYLVVRPIGRGGMATVLEARHEKLGGRVALKVLDPALAAQPLAATRFQREARAAAGVRHDHVLRVFDIGVEQGMPYLVMELLEGEDLATYLARNRVLAVAELLRVFLPVASAVAAAHDAGIVHRDLKPANIMLARRAPLRLHPVVLDFGISKLRDDDGEGALTRSESLLGTVQYMAPELTRGARLASPASDQYAIGVMLYECATGRRPFRGDGHYELLHAIVSAPVVPPGRLRAELPPQLDDIVLRTLSRDPEKRFSSVRALGAALLSLGDRSSSELWADEFPEASRTTNPEQSAGTLSDEAIVSPRAPRNLTGRKLAGAVVVAVLAALAVVAAARPRQSPPPVAARVAVAQPVRKGPAELARPPRAPTGTPLAVSPTGPSVSVGPTVAASPAPTPRIRTPTHRPAQASPRPAVSSGGPATTTQPAAVALGKNGSPILE